MLIDNRNYLRLHQRALLEEIDHLELVDQRRVTVEPSKKGLPTLKLMVDDKIQYIHSKYDPEAEAEKLIGKLEHLEEFSQVLFIGTGLGYQIKELLSKREDISYSIYEPDLEVLYHFLAFQNITKFRKAKLNKIITTQNSEELRAEINNLYNISNKKIFIYTLPANNKKYIKEEMVITQKIQELLKSKRSSLVTNVSFQKRWTINSIKNFHKVLETPNILHDIDKDVFKDKPAIIVAAGPSLNEEFDNLKFIKENGLAYIFSVGSAINALIEHGIYPDAACTYDPQAVNHKVIEIIKNRGISEIPLIFGSSVGFETLVDYPGEMLHMITSQDTISPCLLDTSKEFKLVKDAPSIAVITFQLLSLLECGLIILVGQNLSFQNNIRYAKGIHHKHVAGELSEKEQKKLLMIKDVYGNDVQTEYGYMSMRDELEMYIHASPNTKVINTTRAGAHIEGATFLTLEEVISKKLIEKNIIKKNWYKVKNSYGFEFIIKKNNVLRKEANQCEKQIKGALQILNSIEITLQNRQLNQLEKKFNAFDKAFSIVKKNPFFASFILPMIRVQNERLSEEIKFIKYENNLDRKGKIVVKAFGEFLIDCQANYQFVLPYYEELHEEITTIK